MKIIDVDDNHYRRVSVALQRDRKVLELSPTGQQLWLLLLISPRLMSFGAYAGSPYSLMTDGLGARWFPEGVGQARHIVGELERAGLIEIGEGTIWVPRYLRYNPAGSTNHVRSWAPLVAQLPESDLRDRIVASIAAHCRARGGPFAAAFVEKFGNGVPKGVPNGVSNGVPDGVPNGVPDGVPKGVPKGLPKGLPNQQKNRRTEEQKNQNARARFVKDARAPENRPNNNNDDEQPPTTTTTIPTSNAWGATPTRPPAGRMAWDAKREALSIPHRLHRELLSRMAQPDERALRAWYAETEAAWDGREVPDVFVFWRARFNERQDADGGTAADSDAVQLARINAKRAARAAQGAS